MNMVALPTRRGVQQPQRVGNRRPQVARKLACGVLPITDATNVAAGWLADTGIYSLGHMKQRTRLLLTIVTILLVGFLIWRGPSFYRLYKDWPVISACANDAKDCP